MSAAQQLIDEIRSQLEVEDQSLTEELRRLATEYAALCREVNRRLRHCDELLRQGLRSEAVHLAEQTPKLLDLVNLAEFPEREKFVELVSLYGLPRPESTLSSVAEALNEAYWQQEPLERLLEVHRLLAVGRAPLRDRLEVLRKLRESDPDNAIWEEDVRAMEQARLRQVAGEAHQAAEQEDTERLAALIAELSAETWLAKVPSAAVRGVKQRLMQVSQHKSRRQLDRLKLELDRAFAEMNAAQARALRQQWQDHQSIVKLPEDDPLIQHVAPVFAWLEEEDQRESQERAWRLAISAVESALDEPHSTLENLERLGDDVQRTGRPLPPVLQGRYENRVSGLRLAARRRRQMAIGAGCAGLVVAGLAVGWMIWQQQEQAELRRVVAAVQGLINDHQFAAAHDLLNQAQRFSGSDPWLQVNQQLLQAEAAETARHSEFQDRVALAREADRIESARPHLDRLRQLAITDEEKQAVVRLEGEWDHRRRELMSQKDARVRPLLEKVSSTLAALSDQDVQLLAETAAVASLSQASADLAEIQLLLDGASPELASHRDVLFTRLTALKEAQTIELRRRDLLQELTANSLLVPGDPAWARRLSAFDAARKTYISQHPNEMRSMDFRQFDDAAAARKVLRSQEAMRSWRQLIPQEKESLQQRLQAVEALLADSSHSPDVPVLREYQQFLERLSRQQGESSDSGNGSLRRQILELFDNPVMRDLHVLELKNRDRFYLTEAMSFSPNKPVSFKYVIDYERNLRQSMGVRYDELLIGATAEAPQVRLAKSIRDRFQSVELYSWREHCCASLQQILDAPDLDDLLRLLLLKRFVEFSVSGDRALAHALLPVSAVLAESDIDLTGRWMDPKDTAAKLNRNRVPELLKRIPPDVIREAASAAKAWEDSLIDRLTRRCLAIGWLCRATDGTWVLRSLWRADGTYELCVIPPETDGAAPWLPVGQVAPNDLRLTAAANQPTIHEGQLVYAREIVEPAAAGESTTR